MRLTIPPAALLRRSLLASAGLAVFALGNFLTVKANIGQAPWNVFNLGLTNHLPLTYGQVSIIVSFLVVAADLLLREPIGLGTLLDAVLVGAFFDPTISTVTISTPSEAARGSMASKSICSLPVSMGPPFAFRCLCCRLPRRPFGA